MLALEQVLRSLPMIVATRSDVTAMCRAVFSGASYLVGAPPPGCRAAHKTSECERWTNNRSGSALDSAQGVTLRGWWAARCESECGE